jgi:transcriptional regulator with XRE-family HTH domain
MSEDREHQEPTSHERRPEVVAFGVVLRRYRKRQGLTQEQVSWNSGVDRKFISRIEGGQREPALGTIIKLTTALGVDLGEFMASVATELTATLPRLPRRKTTP